MTILDFIIRISFAVICGFLIGLERQLTGHIAGIRTNVLVSLGACIFVLFSVVMNAPDVTRIAAQIVTGVGFLCSGIIFKDGVNIHGLNTAATIWCTAAIGVMCSSGYFLYGVVATALLLLVNMAFRMIAVKIHPLSRYDEGENTYIVRIVCAEQEEFNIRSLLLKNISGTRLSVSNLKSRDSDDGNVRIKSIIVSGSKRRDESVEQLIHTISEQAGVSSAGWELAS